MQNAKEMGMSGDLSYPSLELFCRKAVEEFPAVVLVGPRTVRQDHPSETSLWR